MLVHAATDHIQGARKQQSGPQIAAQQQPQAALELKAFVLMQNFSTSGLYHIFLPKKGGLLEQKKTILRFLTEKLM